MRLSNAGLFYGTFKSFNNLIEKSFIGCLNEKWIPLQETVWSYKTSIILKNPYEKDFGGRQYYSRSVYIYNNTFQFCRITNFGRRQTTCKMQSRFSILLTYVKGSFSKFAPMGLTANTLYTYQLVNTSMD